ncbi:MAG: transcriptional regulator, partial [Spirochaetaceae bacterium]|nr:transcriptional regulator [Spirochaetaceae bacterium]
FNGLETLRVARSRHTTSDFGRARRQQHILAAIREKFSDLGMSDVGKVYDLARVLSKYVETSFGPYDLVNYFLRYKSAQIRNRIVLDTNNILYHSYTHLRRLNLTQEEVDEDFNKGLYILLPRGDDWSLIHRFILSRSAGPAS